MRGKRASKKSPSKKTPSSETRSNKPSTKHDDPRSAAGHNTSQVKLPQNHCFGCGPHNPGGMKLRFDFDEASRSYICRFKLGKRFTGPPGHCHGGIIATILDEAMGKVNKQRQVVALTSEITVNYLKPVPLNQPLRVESKEVKVDGRKHTNAAEILNAKDEVLARSQGLFIAIDPEKMFAKYNKGTALNTATR